MIMDMNTIPTGKVFECKKYPFVYRDKEGKTKYDDHMLPNVDFIGIWDMNGYLHCRKSTLYLADKIEPNECNPEWIKLAGTNLWAPAKMSSDDKKDIIIFKMLRNYYDVIWDNPDHEQLMVYDKPCISNADELITDIIGAISIGQLIHLSTKIKGWDKMMWYKIVYNGRIGFVQSKAIDKLKPISTTRNYKFMK